MFANRNQTVVRRITRSALRSDKRRNFFMITAIALTVFMIASVFSMAMSYYNAMMDANEFVEQLIQAQDGAGYGMSEVSPALYIGSGIFVAFFMLVGFLLIYNVMYVSVTRDVRFYGLLKTIGTTPRQLRRIVNGQMLRMYLIGLPIGLVLAGLTSFVIVPSLMAFRVFGTEFSATSFSPLIYVGGAIFALITTYLGSSIAAKKVAKLSPVDATKYAGEQDSKLRQHSSGQWKPSRMAWRNLFRERKRAFIVLLNLFLGIMVFTGMMAYVSSTDITAGIVYWNHHDIAISYYGRSDTDTYEFGISGMDRDFIAEIENIPGISEVKEQTQVFASIVYPPESVEKSSDLDSSVQVIGIDRAYMEEINKRLDSPIDIEAFERGELALVEENMSSYKLGDLLYYNLPVGTELSMEIGMRSRIPVHIKIAGYIPIYNMTSISGSFSGNLSLILSNAFLESISARAGVSVLGINVEDGMEDSVTAAISAMIEGRSMEMGSRFEARREEEMMQQRLFVLGSTISGVLGLIGVFNFINLISVGLLTRKREFAALESVGMSKRQLRSMLRWEGAIYWMITIFASLTLGTGFAYGFFRLLRNGAEMFLQNFVYPVLPVAAVFSVIILICTLTPEICYRDISKRTLVERLREVE